MNNPLILSMHLNLSVNKCKLLLENGTFMVLSEEEADSFVERYVNKNLWTFTTRFLLKHSKLPPEAYELLKMYQETQGQNSNEVLKSIVVDMDDLIKSLKSSIGRGLLLGSVNYEEIHVGDYLVYRAL